ncbi:MAG: hypothetical protein FRX49_11577 [Trebouxia sp. A1-2]|nr:MAG: hypothetical protein FRX49_11577 [Trebouxia sp. A1-2]
MRVWEKQCVGSSRVLNQAFRSGDHRPAFMSTLAFRKGNSTPALNFVAHCVEYVLRRTHQYNNRTAASFDHRYQPAVDRVVRYSTAQHSTAQHSTAQHSAAQRSAAQRSAAAVAAAAACYHIAKQQQQSGFHQKVNLLQMGCFGSQIVEKLLGSHDQHAVPHNGNAPPLCSHGRALHKAIHSCGLLCDAVCPLEHFCRIHGKGYLSDARAVYVLPAIQTLTTRKRPKLIGIDSLPDSKTSSQAQQKQYQLSFGSDQIESVLGADSPAKQEGININNEANY